MFQINIHFKEYFRTATFEIILESSPFLNKNTGCTFNTSTGRDSADQFFQKMLENFFEYLIHLSAEASPLNNSSKHLIFQLVYNHLLCHDELSLTRSGSKFYLKSCIFYGTFKKYQIPLFLIFTDVNKIRFIFLNTNKPCQKKSKSPGKNFEHLSI